ncbi:MAG: hypothetical protein HYY37_02605 [Candidatus Aenigmarchaeota archaeon]|nr:hypothetical protein [Candidatus Aenigmarchaeota archaeon]
MVTAERVRPLRERAMVGIDRIPNAAVYLTNGQRIEGLAIVGYKPGDRAEDVAAYVAQIGGSLKVTGDFKEQREEQHLPVYRSANGTYASNNDNPLLAEERDITPHIANVQETAETRADLNTRYQTLAGISQQDVIERYNDFVAKGADVETAYRLALGKTEDEWNAARAGGVQTRALERVDEFQRSREVIERMVAQGYETARSAAAEVPAEPAPAGPTYSPRDIARGNAVFKRAKRYSHDDKNLVWETTSSLQGTEAAQRIQDDFDGFLRRGHDLYECVPGIMGAKDPFYYAYRMTARNIKRGKYKQGEPTAEPVQQPPLPLEEFEGMVYREPVAAEEPAPQEPVPQGQLSLNSMKRNDARRQRVERRAASFNWADDQGLIDRFYDSVPSDVQKQIESDFERIRDTAVAYDGVSGINPMLYARAVIANRMRRGKYRIVEAAEQPRENSPAAPTEQAAPYTPSELPDWLSLPEEHPATAHRASRRRDARERRTVRRAASLTPDVQEFIDQGYAKAPEDVQGRMQSDFLRIMDSAVVHEGVSWDTARAYASAVMADRMRRGKYPQTTTKTEAQRAAEMQGAATAAEPSAPVAGPKPLKEGRYAPDTVQEEVKALGAIGQRPAYTDSQRAALADRARDQRLSGRQKQRRNLGNARRELTGTLRAVYEKQLENQLEGAYPGFVWLPTMATYPGFYRDTQRGPLQSAVRFNTIRFAVNLTPQHTELLRDLDTTYVDVLQEWGSQPETQEEFNFLLDETYQRLLKKYDVQ